MSEKYNENGKMSNTFILKEKKRMCCNNYSWWEYKKSMLVIGERK